MQESIADFMKRRLELSDDERKKSLRNSQKL
jgi:hypothetical protein